MKRPSDSPLQRARSSLPTPNSVRSAIAAPTFRRRLEGSRNGGGHGGGQRVKVLLPAVSAVDTSPSWIRGTRKFMR